MRYCVRGWVGGGGGGGIATCYYVRSCAAIFAAGTKREHHARGERRQRRGHTAANLVTPAPGSGANSTTCVRLHHVHLLPVPGQALRRRSATGERNGDTAPPLLRIMPLKRDSRSRLLGGGAVRQAARAPACTLVLPIPVTRLSCSSEVRWWWGGGGARAFSGGRLQSPLPPATPPAAATIALCEWTPAEATHTRKRTHKARTAQRRIAQHSTGYKTTELQWPR